VSGPAGGVEAGRPARPVQLGLFAAEQLAELLGSLLEPPAAGAPAPSPRHSAKTSAAARSAAAAIAWPPGAVAARPAVRRLASGARGGWLARWSAASASRESVVYIVARRADGTMGCTCPGWL
jgi:hypothetical protein